MWDAVAHLWNMKFLTLVFVILKSFSMASPNLCLTKVFASAATQDASCLIWWRPSAASEVPHHTQQDLFSLFTIWFEDYHHAATALRQCLQFSTWWSSWSSPSSLLHILEPNRWLQLLQVQDLICNSPACPLSLNPSTHQALYTFIYTDMQTFFHHINIKHFIISTFVPHHTTLTTHWLKK